MTTPVKTDHLPRISWCILKRNKQIAWIVTLAFLPELLFLPGSPNVFSFTAALTICLSNVMNGFSYAVCMAFISSLIDQNPLTFGQACAAAWDVAPSLLGLGILSSVAFFALYLPGIWVGAGFMLTGAWVMTSIWALPEIVLTKTPLLKALQSSVKQIKRTFRPFWVDYVYLYGCIMGLMGLNGWIQEWISRTSLQEAFLEINQYFWLYLCGGVLIGVAMAIVSLWVIVLQVVMYRYFTGPKTPAENTIPQDSGNEGATQNS